MPEDNSSAFPGHVTEGTLGVTQVSIDVDTAVEAVEGLSILLIAGLPNSQGYHLSGIS